MHRLQDARGDPRAPDGLSRVGRFAPSPSGELHVGSLVAALASRCDAPAWRVRIDDIDPPRTVPGSASRIVAALLDHGFPGAGAPLQRQSEHAARHRDALRALCADGHLFACACSRRELGPAGCTAGCRRVALDPDALDALLGPDTGAAPVEASRDIRRDGARPAVRVRLGGMRTVADRVLGAHRIDLDRLAADVVVLRRDGLFAYHLATAVDDAHDVDDVVRGADLFDAAAIQGALTERLGRAPPSYAHVPVATDAHGAKLGKSTGAAGLDPGRAARTLHAAWRFLGQAPLPGAEAAADANEALERFWEAAPARWRLSDVPPLRTRRWPCRSWAP